MRPQLARTAALGLMAAASTALGQDAAAPLIRPIPQASHVAAPPPDRELASVLAAWEAASRRIETLAVVFERVDHSTTWGVQAYEGKAVFRKPGRACLEFRKAILDEKGQPRRRTEADGRKALQAEKEPFQRIVWNDREVLQYEWDERAVYVWPYKRQLPRRGWIASILGQLLDNLLEVPSLFLVDAESLQRRFAVRLVRDEGNEAVLELVARSPADRSWFDRATITLDKATWFPSAATLTPAGDKELQEFRFTSIQPNLAIDEAYFHPPTAIPGWALHRHPVIGLK